MQWQDAVISIGQWIMTLALIPSILGKQKPAISSSVMTAVVIAMFGITYGSLALWNSVFSSAACTLAWLILAWQQFRISRRAKKGSVIH